MKENIVKDKPSLKTSVTIRRTILPMLQMRPLSSLQISHILQLTGLFIGNKASTTHMFLGVLVVNKKLAILSVAVSLVSGDRDKVEDAGCLVEDCVHFFKGSVGGFWVEEVYHREDESVAMNRYWLGMGID
jgi:hypothetical protein